MKFKFNNDELVKICSSQELFSDAMKESMGLVLKSMDELGVLPPKSFLLSDIDVVTLPFIFKNYTLEPNELASIQKIYTLHKVQKNSESIEGLNSFNPEKENFQASQIAKDDAIADLSLAVSSVSNHKVVTEYSDIQNLFNQKEGFVYNPSHDINTIEMLLSDKTLETSINLYGSYKEPFADESEAYLYDFVYPWIISVLRQSKKSDLEKVTPEFIQMIKEIGIEIDEIPLLKEISDTYEYKVKEFLSPVSLVPSLSNLSEESILAFIEHEEDLLNFLKKSYDETKSETSKGRGLLKENFVLNVNIFSKKSYPVLASYEKVNPGFYQKLNKLFDGNFINGWDKETLSLNKKRIQEKSIYFSDSGHIRIDKELIASLSLEEQSHIFDKDYSVFFLNNLSKNVYENISFWDFREVGVAVNSSLNLVDFLLLNTRNGFAANTGKDPELSANIGKALFHILNLDGHHGIYDAEKLNISRGFSYMIEKYPDDFFRPDFKDFWSTFSQMAQKYSFNDLFQTIDKELSSGLTLNKALVVHSHFPEKIFSKIEVEENHKSLIKEIYQLSDVKVKDSSSGDNKVENASNNIFLDLGENSKTLNDEFLLDLVLKAKNGLSQIKEAIKERPLSASVINELIYGLTYHHYDERVMPLFLDLVKTSFNAENSLYDLTLEANIELVNKVPELREFIVKKEFTYREFKELNITYNLNTDNSDLRKKINKKWSAVPHDERESILNEYIENKDWENFKATLDYSAVRRKVFALDNDLFLEAGIKDDRDFNWLNSRENSTYTKKQLDFLIGSHLEIIKDKGTQNYSLKLVIESLNSYSEDIKEFIVEKYPVLLLISKDFNMISGLTQEKFNSVVRESLREIDKNPKLFHENYGIPILDLKESSLFKNFLKEEFSFKEKLILSHVLGHAYSSFEVKMENIGNALVAGEDITRESLDIMLAKSGNYPNTGEYDNQFLFPELQKVSYLKENIQDFQDLLIRGLDTSNVVYALIDLKPEPVMSNAFEFLNDFKATIQIKEALSEGNGAKVMAACHNAKHKWGNYKLRELISLDDSNFEVLTSVLKTSFNFIKGDSERQRMEMVKEFVAELKDFYIEGLTSSGLSLENKEILINISEATRLRDETGFNSVHINNSAARQLFSSPELIHVINAIKLSNKISSTLDGLDTSSLEEDNDDFGFSSKL